MKRVIHIISLEDNETKDSLSSYSYNKKWFTESFGKHIADELLNVEFDNKNSTFICKTGFSKELINCIIGKA